MPGSVDGNTFGASAFKIDGVWGEVAANEAGMVCSPDGIAVPWQVFQHWSDHEREVFGAYPVPEPGEPPAGKVETARKLGGTTRPKWIMTYGAAPPAPEPEPTYRTLMTPIRFKAQFSLMEQVAIKRARAYVGADTAQIDARDALDVMFGSLDDPRLTQVDVLDPAVIQGIDFVQSIGILTADRADEIKRGAPT